MSRPWRMNPLIPYERKVKDASEITLEMLEEATLTTIELVDEYSPLAQPLLNRMEHEFFKTLRLKATAQDIRKHMARVAEAIATQPKGQMYRPIFERLERELAA